MKGTLPIAPRVQQALATGLVKIASWQIDDPRVTRAPQAITMHISLAYDMSALVTLRAQIPELDFDVPLHWNFRVSEGEIASAAARLQPLFHLLDPSQPAPAPASEPLAAPERTGWPAFLGPWAGKDLIGKLIILRTYAVRLLERPEIQQEESTLEYIQHLVNVATRQMLELDEPQAQTVLARLLELATRYGPVE